MFTYQTDTFNFQTNMQTEQIEFFWDTFFRRDNIHKIKVLPKTRSDLKRTTTSKKRPETTYNEHETT